MAAKNCFRLPLLLLAVLLGVLASPCAADQALVSPQSLTAGQSLFIGGYSFTMQTDCNLVLYDSGNAVWASGTNGRGSNCRVTMQSDANLVIYDGNGNAVWASNTQRAIGNYVLVLQRDRNVVIYGGSIWATGTNTYGEGVIIDGAHNAAKGVTSGAAAVVVVKAAAGEGQPGLQGRKIAMVTNKA